MLFLLVNIEYDLSYFLLSLLFFELYLVFIEDKKFNNICVPIIFILIPNSFTSNGSTRKIGLLRRRITSQNDICVRIARQAFPLQIVRRKSFVAIHVPAKLAVEYIPSQSCDGFVTTYIPS